MANRADVILSAQDLASANIKEVINTLDELNNKVSEIEGDTNSIDFSSMISALADWKDTALDAVSALLEFADMDEVFVRMAGAGRFAAEEVGLAYEDLTATITKFSDGAVSNFEAVRLANELVGLGVVQSTGDIARIMQIAAARGALFGRTTTQALDDIAIGVGRISPLTLDNLGFIVRAEESFERYAAGVGKATSELTQLEQKQAILAELFRQSEGAINAGFASQANSADQFAASLENVGVAAGAAFSAIATLGRTGDSLLARGLDAVSDVLNKIAKSEGLRQMELTFDAIQKKIIEVERAQNELQRNPPADLGDRQAASRALNEEKEALRGLISALGLYKQEVESIPIPFNAESQDFFESLSTDFDTSGIEGFNTNIDRSALNMTKAQVESRKYDFSLAGVEAQMRAVAAAGLGAADSVASLTLYMNAFNAAKANFNVNEGFVGNLAGLALRLPEGEQLDALNEATELYSATSFEIEQGNHSLQERLLLEKKGQNAAADIIQDRLDELKAIEDGNKAIDSRSDALIKQAAQLAPIVGAERAAAISAELVNNYRLGVAEIDKMATSDQERLFLIEQLNARQNEYLKGIKAEGNERSGIVENERNALDQLEQRVQGVLQGALSLDVGVNLDDILGREDAINEPARRLADIAVNGFNSPWVDYFKNDFPKLWEEISAGDIKINSAAILREFETGNRPELLNLDIAQSMIEDMISGEQKILDTAKGLAEKIARETGVGYDKVFAKVASSLGSTDQGVQVAAYGSGLTSAFESEDIGSKASAIVADQFTQSGNALLRSAGAENAMSYQAGFGTTSGLQGVTVPTADPSAAKANIQKMLFGAVGVAEIMQQIVSEVAALIPTVGFERITSAVGASFGSVDQNPQIERFAAGLAIAIATQNVGGQATELISQQITSDTSLERVFGAGITSGESYAKGFLNSAESNIPPKLIRVLADLVTPAVLSTIAREQSRQASE